MTDFDLFEKALTEYGIQEDIEKNEKALLDYGIQEDIIDIEKSIKIEFVLCTHSNFSNEGSIIYCTDCGEEIEKNIYQDKEWRYYGQTDNKRTSDPNRVIPRKFEDRNIYKDVENS